MDDAPSAFAADPARDAGDAIAGFVYQVDRTVLEWLHLPAGGLLLLECGEDIDLVAPVLLDENNTPERLLVQVKKLARRITLRTPAALSAVVHLSGHRARNPGHAIKLRFLTTASAGQETPSAFGEDVKPALPRWNQIRATGDLAGDPDGLNGLHQLLSSSPRPSKGISDSDWQSFSAALDAGPDTGLFPLIMGLEWALDADAAETVKQSIRLRLIECGHAHDEGDAARRHDALFVHVFRMLSESGDRNLDLQAVSTIMAAPGDANAVAAGIRARLAGIESEISQLSGRVDAHDATLTEHGQILETLSAIVQAEGAAAVGQPVERNIVDPFVGLVSRLTGIQGQGFSVASDELDPAPPIDGYTVSRPSAAAKIAAALETHKWVHVWGSIRSGKTTIVRQATSGRDVLWIGLRGLDVAEAHARLRSALRKLDALGETAVVLCDDGPELDESETHIDRIIALAARLPNGVKLVTNGARSLPRRLVEGAWPFAVTEIRAPRFTHQETKDLVARQGATAAFVNDEACIATLLTLTAGHAECLRHACLMLSSVGWPDAGVASLESVFRPDEDQQQRSTILRRLIGTVSSAPARELLYRLCVPNAPFSRAEVAAIAGVEPLVGPPGELTALLDGLWLEVESARRWTVSPAIQPFGNAELSAPTRTGVHRVVGEGYLHRRILTPNQVARCIGHLELGNEADAAGIVLVQYLRKLCDDDRFELDPGLIGMWRARLPPSMSADVAALVRANQLYALFEAERELAPGLAQLIDQVKVAPPSPKILLAVTMTSMQPIGHRQPETLFAWLLDVVSQWDAIVAELGDESTRIFEAALTTSMAYVKRPSHVDPWLQMISRIPEAARQEWMRANEFFMAARVTSNALWMSEADLPEPDRRWHDVYGALTRLIGAGHRYQSQVLVATATAAGAVVLAEKLKNLPGALELSDEALRSLSVPAARALVEDVAGRQLLYQGNASGGRERLKRGIAQYPDEEHVALERFDALFCASRAAALVDDFDDAIDAATRAIAVARQHSTWVPTLQLVAGLAELAILQWKAGSLARAWTAFDNAAEMLLGFRNHDAMWRDRFVLLGHVSGFLTSVAATGSPPSAVPDGQEYAEPRLGMFFTSVPGRADLYQGERMASLLPAQLVGFASAVGDHARAVVWARRSIAASNNAGLGHLAIEAELVLAADRLRSLDLAAAMEHYERSLMALESGHQRRIHGSDFFERGPNLRMTDVEARRKLLIEDWLRSRALLVVGVTIWAQEDLDKRRRLASFAQGYCATQASVSSDPDPWTRMSDLFRVLDETPARQIEILTTETRNPPLDAENTRWAIARLWLSHPSLMRETRELLTHHFALAQVLEPYAKELDVAYTTVVVPALVRFWRRECTSKRFALRSPRVTIDELAEIAAGDRRTQYRRTLLAVADGFGISVQRELRDFLR